MYGGGAGEDGFEEASQTGRTMAGCRDGHARGDWQLAHQPWVPGSPLNGPTTFDVIQPP